MVSVFKSDIKFSHLYKSLEYKKEKYLNKIKEEGNFY